MDEGGAGVWVEFGEVGYYFFGFFFASHGDIIANVGV